MYLQENQETDTREETSTLAAASSEQESMPFLSSLNPK